VSGLVARDATREPQSENPGMPCAPGFSEEGTGRGANDWEDPAATDADGRADIASALANR